MAKFDLFAEYNEKSRDIFNFTNANLKSFVKLKAGYVKNKDNELKTHKNFIKNKNYTYSIGNFKNINQISGIYENFQDLQNYMDKLPKSSFAIWFKFKLKAPYFSKDDDEFYIIQNPVIKETNFKVPMVRSSAWKGALANAFKDLINEETDFEIKKSKIEGFLRIFGAGSEIIKELETYLKSKSENLDKFKDEFLNFVLFELGLEVNQELIQSINGAENYKDVSNILAEKVWDKYKDLQKNLPIEFQTHKGRVIFFPTYFDRLSLEIINPHDRRKRAGTNPIHYEVVPKETEGIFQIIYIPFDAVLKKDAEVRKEAQEDLNNIIQALNILSKNGIEAKTKLGWGCFEILDNNKKVCITSDLEVPEE